MPTPIPHRAALVARAALAVVVLGAAAVAVAAPRAEPGSPLRGTLAPAGFTIAAPPLRPLAPGRSQRLELRLTNPHRWALRIVRISVELSVDAAHARAGCARGVHFGQVAIPRRSFPLYLPARSRRTLRQLGVRRAPLVTMRNLPVSQDACKGARLKLRFVGRAARTPRPLAR